VFSGVFLCGGGGGDPHMSPKDPVQQATPRRLRRLVPIQVRGPCPLRPEYIKVAEALRLDHLQDRKQTK